MIREPETRAPNFTALTDADEQLAEPAPVKPFPAHTQHCLVFYLKGSVSAFTHDGSSAVIYPKIAVNGSQINRFNFHLSAAFLMFSVNFHPWVLSKLLRLPLTDFVDDRIDGEAVLPPGINSLHQQMAQARRYDVSKTLQDR